MPSRQPKVLHLFNSFNHGGTEGQILQQLRSLQETGRYRLFVACQSGAGVLRRQVESLGFTDVPSYPLNCMYDVNMLRQIRRFALHLRRLGIHILHTHDLYTNVFGLAAGVLARVPVRIVSRRELDVFTPRQRWIELNAFSVAHAVVANCEFLREKLVQEKVAASLTTTIYNSVHPGEVKPLAISERTSRLTSFGLPPHFRFVTMVANLHNVKKDYRTFMSAAQLVCANRTDIAFVMAGDGEQQSMRQLVGELGITDRVFMLGRCARIAELLSITDVGVLSSISEGLSNSLLEYMAAGLPIVASDVGGTREAITDGETGLLVPPGNATAMAERILGLLRDKLKASQMGEAARHQATVNFSPVRQLERTELLYHTLLAKTQRHSGHRHAG